jgi:hypothetical protein
MTNKHWSTRDVSARDQFAYWREAVCEAVMNVATENPAEHDFFGDIACAAYGELRFAAFTSSPHQVVRRASHIANYTRAISELSMARGHSASPFRAPSVASSRSSQPQCCKAVRLGCVSGRLD